MYVAKTFTFGASLAPPLLMSLFSVFSTCPLVFMISNSDGRDVCGHAESSIAELVRACTPSSAPPSPPLPGRPLGVRGGYDSLQAAALFLV